MNTKPARALLFYGGWAGHEPEAFAHLLADALLPHGLETDLRTDTRVLEDAEALLQYDLIIPCWTMGQLEAAPTKALREAVEQGTGLAGIHGGMGDAFRGNLAFEWMVGGHFVGHPHVGPYTVEITDAGHEITQGLPTRFAYESEQYYLLTDPDIHVLARADYPFQGHSVPMPVAWTRLWGKGRVFYSALGHAVREYETCREAFDLAIRGLLWAARRKPGPAN